MELLLVRDGANICTRINDAAQPCDLRGPRFLRPPRNESKNRRYAPKQENPTSRERPSQPVPYGGPRGIRALLDGMQHLLGWGPIMEGENIIGLADVTGGGAVSFGRGGG